MKKLTLLFTSLFVAALFAGVSVAQDPAKTAGQKGQTPEALLADLYKQHNAGKGPFFQTGDRALVDKYFVKSTADLIWKLNNNKSTDKYHGLGGDPMYGVPPDQVTGLNIEEQYESVVDKMPEIQVHFNYRSRDLMVAFHFKKDNGVWKIDEIQWDDAARLIETLNGKDETDFMPPETTANSRFSGTYKIGDETCYAVPIRRHDGAHVRCAGTHASETFRRDYEAEDDRTFKGEAGDLDNPKNRFVFDPGFNSGKYYPGDGKVLPVKRIK